MKWIKRLVALGSIGMLIICGILGYASTLPTPEGIPVLEYHMINDEVEANAAAYAVPPEEFRAQLAYLEAHGYTTISMLDFMKAKKGKLTLPEKPLILTFDDGYEDNYTTMLPILEEHHMKATVYMVTNFIGKKGYLTWEQLRDMEGRGIEIGAHTANHIPLTELSAEKQREELKLSKLLLEWNGIKTVFTFSYPNGAYNDEIINMVKEEEYLTAVSGDTGLNTFATDPYQLQRINIPRAHFGMWEFEMRLKKAELFTKLGLWQHRTEQ